MTPYRLIRVLAASREAVTLVEDLLGKRRVLVGPPLVPGRTGLVLARTYPERHPRYGLQERVLEARPLEPEELTEALLARLQGDVSRYLELLAEAGHTAYPVHLLARRLGLTEEEVARRLEGRAVLHLGHAGLEAHFRAEKAVLALIQRGRYRVLRPPPDHTLSPSQAQVFRLFAQGRVAALTGGPGTGKSHTVATLLRSPDFQKMRVALAAPTGKAARRLFELSGQEAITLHRLLRYTGDPKRPFFYGQGNPLPYELVVVDEAGMVDLPLMVHLLQALPKEGLLLLVGDPHQLPPVGPGEPFSDLLPRIPHLKLTETRRQKAKSGVAQAAALFLQGREPNLEAEDFQLVLLDASPEALAQEAVRLYEALRAEVGEVVLLTPTNSGPLGVYALNARLQARLNPKGPALPVGGGLLVRIGDPVVATVNDYALGLMNGETGVVVHLDPEGNLGLRLKDRNVLVPREAHGILLPAYALSVHRSQGSEWAGVVVALHAYQEPLLSRELVYTALTRAKRKVVLLASPKALYLSRERRAGRRHTWMKVI